MNKDTETLKIKILSDYYHSRLNSLVAYISSAGIAFIIFFASVLIQTGDYITYSFGLVATALWFIIGYQIAFRMHHNRLDHIDKLFQQINKEKPLPTLKELRK